MGLPKSEEIMEAARVTELSPWFKQRLQSVINTGEYRPISEIAKDTQALIQRLAKHREAIGKSVVAIGMSGGLDSALTASLFKAAGWDVKALLLPIHQNEKETRRGLDVCNALELEPKVIDLTSEYNLLERRFTYLHDTVLAPSQMQLRIRQGNMRARLRMIALYDCAQAYGGVVASTDNLSELTAGFWTLHGDVGDIAPVQSYNKSWDIPMMAAYMNVPYEVIRAKPTDGLGIAAGDEDQLGCSYLEWDIVMHTILRNVMIYEKAKKDMSSKFELKDKFDIDAVVEGMAKDASAEDEQKIEKIVGRMKTTSFKQMNPHNYDRKQNPRWIGVLGSARQLAETCYPAQPL